MSAELRKEQRLRAKYGALASFFPPTPDSSLVLGRLIDISPRGLALQYFAKQEPDTIPHHLEIFGIHRPLIHIERIPGKIVYDMEIESSTGSVLKERRCGVQFGSLTDVQRTQLEFFMENYTFDQG